MRKSLILFRGLPGTGKTYLAKKLKERLPELILISRDSVRAKVFVNPQYSNEEKEQLLSVILFTIEEHSGNDSIIIDGMTFPTRESMEPFRKSAEQNNMQLRIIECFCTEETALKRISDDVIEKAHPVVDTDEDLYYHVREIFEPFSGFHLKINTEDDDNKNIDRIVAYLSARIMKIYNDP